MESLRSDPVGNEFVPRTDRLIVTELGASEINCVLFTRGFERDNPDIVWLSPVHLAGRCDTDNLLVVILVEDAGFVDSRLNIDQVQVSLGQFE